MNLVVATTNRGKIAEFGALLRDRGIGILSLLDFPDMPPVPEDGETFVENALAKARAACTFTGLPALADDSGLEVDALGGLPGIRSARFAPASGERNEKLLAMMRDVPPERRTARFVCALALARPDGFEWTVTETCEGLITDAPRGSEGFGYDPLFLYPPLGRTFAEIPLAEKNRFSHRGRALAAFDRAVRGDRILDFPQDSGRTP
jgi:XTP/dITP diphosphohydrolase